MLTAVSMNRCVALTPREHQVRLDGMNYRVADQNVGNTPRQFGALPDADEAATSLESTGVLLSCCIVAWQPCCCVGLLGCDVFVAALLLCGAAVL